MLFLRILILQMFISENICIKNVSKSIVSDVGSKYKKLVNEKTYSDLYRTIETFDNCDLEEDEDDSDSLNACFCNQLDCFELYCELGSYLESSDCVDLQMDINPRIFYVYDNLKKYSESIGFGLRPIDRLHELYNFN